VLSVVLHFAPTREQHQFVVGGAAAVLEVSCGQSEVLKSFAVSDERDATSATELAEDLGHCAAVGAAQDGLRVDDSGGRRRSARGGGDGAGDVGCASDAQGLPGDGEPPVGLDGYGGAEAERLREGAKGSVEPAHDVTGAAPAVDGLCRVSDHDQLCVSALGCEHLLQDGVGVLGLVEQQEVSSQRRFSQCPHLQVVVVFERDASFVGSFQICPHRNGVGQHEIGELVMAGLMPTPRSWGTWAAVMSASAEWQ
jgi:hypothetical protein